MTESAYKSIYKTMFLTLAFLSLDGAAKAQAASSPPYTLNQAAIAGGGGKSTDAGNTFTVEGTIGQALTDQSAGAPFRVKSGFFTAAAPLAPTAATVNVSGRIQTATGRGIRNVRVTMTDQNGNRRTATSGLFGTFRFSDVAVGETYIFTATGKRYNFSEPTIVVSLTEGATGLSFTALPR